MLSGVNYSEIELHVLMIKQGSEIFHKFSQFICMLSGINQLDQLGVCSTGVSERLSCITNSLMCFGGRKLKGREKIYQLFPPPPPPKNFLLCT